MPALVEQGGVDLAQRQVHEARGVPLLEHGRAFRLAQGPRRSPPRRRGSRGPTPTGSTSLGGSPRTAHVAAMPSRGPIWVTVPITRSRRPTAFPATPPLVLQFNQRLRPLGALLPPADLPGLLCQLLVPRIDDAPRGPRLFGAPTSSPRSRAARHVVGLREDLEVVYLWVDGVLRHAAVPAAGAGSGSRRVARPRAV